MTSLHENHHTKISNLIYQLFSKNDNWVFYNTKKKTQDIVNHLIESALRIIRPEKTITVGAWNHLRDLLPLKEQ